MAREELAETLATASVTGDVLLGAPRQAAAEPPLQAPPAPVAGSIVPHRQAGMPMEALSADYRRIVELVDAEPIGGEGVSAKELAARLGLETVPAKIEGVRSKAKRLAARGRLEAAPTGRFTPRPPTASDPAPTATSSGGRGGGS
ncbi:hypothetical protein ACWEKM_31860 [Streptomyces sp. NPDC004752]